MGKKSKILYYSVLIVNVLCFLLDLIPGIKFTFFRISFAVSLMLIGLLLLARAVKLKLDSSMFIGIILFWFGVFNGLQYFAIVLDWVWLTTLRIVPYYLFSISFASLVTGIYFKHKLQLKLFVLFLVTQRGYLGPRAAQRAVGLEMRLRARSHPAGFSSCDP